MLLGHFHGLILLVQHGISFVFTSFLFGVETIHLLLIKMVGIMHFIMQFICTLWSVPHLPIKVLHVQYMCHKMLKPILVGRLCTLLGMVSVTCPTSAYLVCLLYNIFREGFSKEPVFWLSSLPNEQQMIGAYCLSAAWEVVMSRM